MARKYDFKTIETKWHEKWASWRLYRAPEVPERKYYVLVMFAYPSGDIHMGHFRNYAIGDVVARYRMMAGYDVLHPFGWDAFGLPAEGAAIENKTHPRTWTLGNIDRGRRSLKKMGISYDWEREFLTCEPDYYKWTQWLFLLLFNRGLAYQAPSTVNWCEQHQTILANEQCQDGTCWRCGEEVVKRELDNCWFFKYTDYAQRLLEDLDTLDGWPENVKTMQRQWIGRSEGCEIDFEYEGRKVSVFTTRPDTTWGVTFMVLAPEHPIAAEAAKTNPQVAAYLKKAAKKSELERAAVGEKDGVFTGKTITNLVNGEKVQLWVADYVVATYGTGLVMGVPAHDTRDFAFAKKYGIPIRVVIQPAGETLAAETMEDAYVDEGVMVNSGDLDGTPTPSGLPEVIDAMARKGLGRAKVQYRLRDWLISRQRYWGCPIPIIHCAKCGPQAVPEEELPVLLPEGQIDFIPRARSPLADNPEYMKATCPKCGGAAQRDPDTMDTFMCSSFYLFRYCDARNEKELWRRSEADKWCPIDIYIGGVEHACMHLLYFRFITKVCYDAGLLPADEPVKRLFNHGMVLDAQGDIMSKSKGNVVSPGEVFEKWGVDVCRLAMLFFAPSEDELRWKEDGLVGARRFVERVWHKVHNLSEEGDHTAARRKLHQVIRKVTRTMERDLHYNTSIAAIMELLNVAPLFPKEVAEGMVQLLAPMAPFLAEELWETLGHTESVFRSGWPRYEPELAKEEEVEVVLQVNGKLRGRIRVSPDLSEDELQEAALASESIQKHLAGKTLRKVIVVRGRLVNFVV